MSCRYLFDLLLARRSVCVRVVVAERISSRFQKDLFELRRLARGRTSAEMKWFWLCTVCTCIDLERSLTLS